MSALAERIARVGARAASLRAEREAEQAKVRAMFPLNAEKVDDFRRVFGAANVKATHVQEGEHRRGKPSAGRSMNANEWLAYVRTGEGWEKTCSA